MSPSTLDQVLEQARQRGLLGPAPIDEQRRHALGFAAVAPAVPVRAVDLGSGGGVPGLVLAEHWPTTKWVLLDGARRSAGFLEGAVLELGWVGRVEILHERAELTGRDPTRRGAFDFACARSFGPPAVVAECAAPLLAVGGHLIVSDPPTGGQDRWQAAGLAELGMAVHAHAEQDGHFTVLTQERVCPERYPRLPGTPSKRPLF